MVLSVSVSNCDMDFGALAVGLGQLNDRKKRRQDESPGREGLESTSEGAKKDQKKDELILLLQLAARSRHHDAALYRTFMMDSNTDYVRKGNQATKQYGNLTKGKKGHKEGMPQQHLFGTWVHVLKARVMAQEDERGLAQHEMMAGDLDAKFEALFGEFKNRAT